jgi:hypothetical protein
MNSTTTSLGTIVTGGLTYQITRIELRGGKFIFTASRHGEAPELVNEPVTIFGQDGRGICQGGMFSVRATRHWHTTEITVTLKMERVW